ncbi:hypothetical protein P22_2233 [Propionispora sp. 2/2-37]|uniref:deoxyuridine 5'-triphosphate nucleotidohydrolase n=1 Tax=Propionispora sp. 2/2-37 TaxID=1677858 RepID=UPI0006BB7C49|nr:deoxyuridine 5'-triphosphate nucleotidohydrolase [Propionispora sp. 2/2-37]CUH96145.1 hypothetical protein P22_2233 [Propionispora sp. 2/2-37]
MKIRGFEIVSQYRHTQIKLPERKTSLSAGYDLAAAEAMTIHPQTITVIPTGLKVYMQPDEYLGIHIRSSLAIKKGLVLINGQGIIDADYYNNPDNEGHILIAVFSHNERPVEVAAGDRIAQGIFYKYLLADTDHPGQGLRAGGIGSTGK